MFFFCHQVFLLFSWVPKSKGLTHNTAKLSKNLHITYVESGESEFEVRFWLFSCQISPNPDPNSQKIASSVFLFFLHELNWFDAWKMYHTSFNVSVDVCLKKISKFWIFTRFDCLQKIKKFYIFKGNFSAWYVKIDLKIAFSIVKLGCKHYF